MTTNAPLRVSPLTGLSITIAFAVVAAVEDVDAPARTVAEAVGVADPVELVAPQAVNVSATTAAAMT